MIFFLFVLLTILARIREEINGQNQNTSVFQSITRFHLCQGTLLCCSNSIVSDNFGGDNLSLTGSQNLTQSGEIRLKKMCGIVLFPPGDRKILHRNFPSCECPDVPPCDTFIIKQCCINRA